MVATRRGRYTPPRWGRLAASAPGREGELLTLTIQGDPGDTALAFSSFGQHPTYVSELGGASLLADRTFLGVVPLAGSGAGRWKLRVPEGVMPAEAPVLPACIQS